jgi:predicted nucleic acid-binding protein
MYLPDTSCLVALLCSWHEHHDATLREMNQRARSGDLAILAGHSLVETFAVLTRLPYPFRLSEQDAFRLLEENFAKTPIVTLTSTQYWRVLKESTEKKISGGQIYDALIAACARKARAPVLLTWNQDHFGPFQDRNLCIKGP